MAASSEHFVEAFSVWLKARGINITDADKKKKISFFSGDAQNPQNGLSFTWCVLLYFDISEKSIKQVSPVKYVPSSINEGLSQQISKPDAQVSQVEHEPCKKCGKSKAKITYTCPHCGWTNWGTIIPMLVFGFLFLSVLHLIIQLDGSLFWAIIFGVLGAFLFIYGIVETRKALKFRKKIKSEK